jgi:hypothetical protein
MSLSGLFFLNIPICTFYTGPPVGQIGVGSCIGGI